MLKFFLAILLLLNASGCGTESKAGPYADLSTVEKARQALDADDFATAIELYNQAIEENAEDYESYRFLAAAYAAAGGFDIFAAVEQTLGGGGGGGSLIDNLGDFVPKDPTDEQIDNMNLARDTILRLPEEYRSNDSEIETASSTAQQLELYQAAASVIAINKFAKATPDGGFDPEQLDTMTTEDVDNILGNFEQIAGTEGSPLSEGASSILAQIDAAPGESRRDKLIDYLNNR